MAHQPEDILSTNRHQGGGQISLPNATASLVLGILSLVFCAAYGILGVILGGIGFYLAKQDKKLLDIDPSAYSTQSISNLNAGRVCSLIGLILGSIFLGIILLILLFVGIAALNLG